METQNPVVFAATATGEVQLAFILGHDRKKTTLGHWVKRKFKPFSDVKECIVRNYIDFIRGAVYRA